MDAIQELGASRRALSNPTPVSNQSKLTREIVHVGHRQASARRKSENFDYAQTVALVQLLVPLRSRLSLWRSQLLKQDGLLSKLKVRFETDASVCRPF